MIDTILQIVYILITIAMVALILLQRGAGAQAGSGFGAGASGTVFGARGSTNFLTTATKWLAVVFFGLSLFMAWKAVNLNTPAAADTDIGVMSGVPAVPESGVPAASAPAAELPAVPATSTAPAVAPVVKETAEPAATAAAKPVAAEPAPVEQKK
ncbi:MAG: preprotein translocase subunit SecG [Arenimonas sp.]|nr:preprotein translocase subunit SecG [Arenimonas sp.]